MPARVVVSLHFPSPLNVLLTIPGKYAVRLQNLLGPAGGDRGGFEVRSARSATALTALPGP